MGRTIGILSLKGGVGKTSVVVSLGSAIAEFGKKVLLIDGNFSAPNLGMHLNIIEPDITIHHVLNGTSNITDSIVKFDDFNFDVIPAAIFFNKPINVLKLKDKIKNLKDDYDVILIDSSPALNDETLAVMLASDEIFIVTTPDYPTLSTTLKSVKDARSRNIKIDGLILNKVYGKPFELSLNQIEEVSGVPVLAVIPQDISVAKSQSDFSSPFLQNPKSKGSDEFRKLAGIIVGEKYKPFSLRTFFKLPPKRQDINRELFYESVFK